MNINGEDIENAKNRKAVKALLNLEDAKLDKEGNIGGVQEQIDKLLDGETDITATSTKTFE